jgi:preprotein translocase subunit SecA
MAVKAFSTVLRKVFGSRNERMVKRYLRIVDQVSAREGDVSALTDAELRARTAEFRGRLQAGESATTMIPEVFAVAREAMDRAVGIREIFNPLRGFEPSKLPAEARRLYEETKRTMESTSARPPAEDLLGCAAEVPAWRFVDIPVPVYAAVRELYPQSRPPFRARPFDVQIIGAVVLYEGRIAEMKTGEGKTIVAPLATYLAALEGKQVHVITVNDYLVQRDRDWTFPFFRALGLTVGAIHPQHMMPPPEKKKAYACNVVYGTTSEFGFDYLRDNMKLSVAEQVQRRREFAIVDEVDSVLIDEARTPLIISGPAHQHKPRYDMADKLARHLLELQREWNVADQKVQSCLVEISGLEGDIRNARDKEKIPALRERLEAARKRLPDLEAERDKFIQYYEVELDKKKATLTHQGIEAAQKQAGVGSFYTGDNIDLPHLLEQAIRAHTVYQRDRDYVVVPDDEGVESVIIVDPHTGRKMIGRQWSDGLHQAVEAKEAVPIKEETQTMATITIQNFYKLYDRLAGMTGTADTEATEFYEIYRLDVVVIPTNLPMIRTDRDDLVFMAEKDKWDSIVDEIERFHDVGRPVLVGTTSVERSDSLSKMLKSKHRVEHNVLNAKHHEREAEIIAHAGELGGVTVSTNMAGRGTDIRLGTFGRQDLIDHWKRRGICPRTVTPEMDDAAVVAAVFRHIAPKELEREKRDVEAMSDDEIRIELLRAWGRRFTWLSDGKIAGGSEDELRRELDQTGTCIMHRLGMFRDVEEMGGLHVVGTERHESRRIDNQLRGRAGRQGDQGSSRFFLSLEDDLMKMFAGPATLKMLSRLGMKEGDAIQNPLLTKSVGRAQRKVEERNFLIRKNILEYDEVMDHQRHDFYGMRQDVLEGRGVKELIFEHIEDSVEDAASRYLDKSYAANCIAEWIRETLSVSIDPDRIRGKDREDLHKLIAIDAKEEATAMIRIQLGEYMSDEQEPAEWGYQPFADWANSNFKANVTAAELRDMDRPAIARRIEESAATAIDAADLAPLDQYLVPSYGEKELARWANNKFGTTFTEADFRDVGEPEAAVARIMEQARAAYRRRELTYPIEFAIEMTTASLQANPLAAVKQFCRWVGTRYELQWDPTALPSTNPRELYTLLVAEGEKWDDERMARRAAKALEAGRTPEALDQWFQHYAGQGLTDDEKAAAAEDPEGVARRKVADVLRTELTQFERWVILQIIDQAWKDHLYAIDQLRESIGLRAFSQRDPRIEFKREGARLYEEMRKSIRDKVTDLIFKAKLSPQPVARPQPAPAPRPQPAPVAAGVAPARAAAAAAARRDVQAAQPATAAAATAQRRSGAAERPATAVGRNEPCPCGSGKKFKQCCGKKG